MASAQELVQSCSNVFTLPEIYFRVRDVVDNPDSTMDDLARVLRMDPGISARLLKIVNSPLYGFPKQVDTVTRAVNLLGMQAVRDLVTATTVGRSFSGMTVQIMDLSAYWRKSVLCALMAGKIAKACGIEDSERFFIEGLLRDIGHLVLYQTIPERAQSALIEAGNLGNRWRKSSRRTSGVILRKSAPNWSISGACRFRSSRRFAINWPRKEPATMPFTHRWCILQGGGRPRGDASSQAPQDVSFQHVALQTTNFKAEERPLLLKEATEQLQETVQLFSPVAKAA